MRYGHRCLCLLSATLLLAGIVACGGGSRSGVVAGGADVALAGSREWAEFPAGFDILPPINQPKTGLGALNPDAMPVIEIYTGSEAAPGSLVHRVERPEIAIVDGHFQYDWDTDGSTGGLPSGTTDCVIEIHWKTTFLGFADCVVDRPNGKGKKTSDPEFFDLVSGRTLPIKFIIDGTVEPPPPVAVTVAPAEVTLASGATQQFVATVTGASNTSVTWAVQEAGGGTVSATGAYTAPAAEGTYHVVATSVEDPTKSATATVAVACTAGGDEAVPWVAVPPVIDGRVDDAEWADANHVVWKFRNQAGTRERDYDWWLEHDGTWLYLGTRTPLTQQWDTYVAMLLDGDDDDQFVGSLVEPHTDLIVGQPGPNAWDGYNYYNAGNTGQKVSEPLDTDRDYEVVAGQLQFEFKIKLSDLDAHTGQKVGAFFLAGEDGTAGNQDKYPATASADAPCSWLELVLSDVRPVAVAVEPAAVALTPGGTQRFVATVTGTLNTAVTWTVLEGSAGGTITAGGDYTAPLTEGTYHVVATSAADPSKSATATVAVSAPSAVGLAHSAWPKWMGNVRNTGLGLGGGASGVQLWAFPTGAEVHAAPAIGVDGTVYIGSWNGLLFALNGATGAERWRFNTGGNIAGAPAVASDGTVIVTSGSGKCFALDGANGAQKWVFTSGGLMWSSPAIAGDGTVYVGSFDHKLYALNGSTGVTKWVYTSPYAMHGTAAALGADGTLYMPSGPNVIALNPANGALRWQFATGGAASGPVSIGSDGTVYVGSWDHRVYALNGTTGGRIWDYTTAAEVAACPAIGADGTVYLGSYDRSIYALDGRTGAKTWQYVTAGRTNAAGAIGTDGVFYVPSTEGNRLYALDTATGTKRWEFLTGGNISSSPAIGADGTIYFGSFDGKVYAVR